MTHSRYYGSDLALTPKSETAPSNLTLDVVAAPYTGHKTRGNPAKFSNLAGPIDMRGGSPDQLWHDIILRGIPFLCPEQWFSPSFQLIWLEKNERVRQVFGAGKYQHLPLIFHKQDAILV